MSSLCALLVSLHLLTSLLAWQDPKPPSKEATQGKTQAIDPTSCAGETAKLMEEMQRASERAATAFQEASTPEQKAAVRVAFLKARGEYGQRFLALAKKHAADATSLSALEVGFQIAVTGDADLLAKAIVLLQENHLTKKEMERFCAMLIEDDSKAGDELLKAVVAKNSVPSARAHAHLALAERAVRNSEDDTFKPEEKRAHGRAAEEHFSVLVQDYASIPDLTGESVNLGTRAKQQLFALRHLSLGKVAPEIEGKDAEGKELKLSDYRGKVVVLDFWASWCGPCMQRVPHQRELAKRLANKPVAFLGINVDESAEILKKTAEAHQMTWRHWYDGANGPISRTWNVKFLPTIYVLDAKGVIRYKGVRGEAMDTAVETLLKELAAMK